MSDETLPQEQKGDFKRRTAIAKRNYAAEGGNITQPFEQIERLIAGLVPIKNGEAAEGEEEGAAISRMAYDCIISFLGISQDFLAPIAEKFTDDPTWEFLSRKYKLDKKELEATYDKVAEDPVRLEAILRLAKPWERSEQYLELLFTEAVAAKLREGDYKTLELYAKITKRIADGKGPMIQINQDIAAAEAKNAIGSRLRILHEKD